MKLFSPKKIKMQIASLISLGLLSQVSIAAPSDTLDDIFLSVAKEQPRFAGAYKDQGQLVILTTDGQALTELGALSELGIDQTLFDNAETKAAKYNFAQLAEANNELLNNILDLQGPSGGFFQTDIDERQNRVKLTVFLFPEDFSDTDEVAVQRQTILAKLSNSTQQELDMEIFDVNFREESQPPFLLLTPPFNTETPTLLSALPQSWSGMRIIGEDNARCTWGFTATLNNQRGFLTNSHCTLQPGFNFLGGIPTLSRNFRSTLEPNDTPLITKSLVDPLPVNTTLRTAASVEGDLPPFCQQRACRHSDSQFAQFVPGFDAPSGYIARPEAQDSTVTIDPENPTFNTTKVGGLLLMGDVVHKVGSSTGWTSGPVLETCINIIAPSDTLEVTTVTFLCNNYTDLRGFPGDSGAAVFTIEPNGTDVRLRGLLHSGLRQEDNIHDTDTFYSPINQVIKDLGALSDISVDSNRPQPSLDTAQVPGYIHQGHVAINNEETRIFKLDVLESGQYDITIQNAGRLDSRVVEVKIGDQVELLSLDDFDSTTNLVTITTEHLPQGQHELSISAQTTDILLRHIQAVKSGSIKFPVPNKLADRTDVISRTRRSNTLPGQNPGGFFRSTTIPSQQTAELNMSVLERGNYEVTLEFVIAKNSQVIEVNFNGTTIRRALDANVIDVDSNPRTELLVSTQTFKFFDVPKGEQVFSIRSDSEDDIILQPGGDAITIK